MTDHAITNNRQGFTLIELLVVIVIISVLAALAIPKLNDARNRARETQTAANLSQIHGALESFGVDNNSHYPFRVRWFSDALATSANFDPAIATDVWSTNNHYHSDPPSFFSLGLFGGVRVVTDSFTDNTGNPTDPVPPWYGMKEHKIIQPFGFDFAFYRRFNQYSDPLVAMGYLDAYPENPFFKRPMGNIIWNYGTRSGTNLYDRSIPDPEVITTPGDFCYTFFYGTGADDTSIEPDPPGVVEAKKSYTVETSAASAPGVYYLDVVDSYQLWAYGILPKNGPAYVVYPNNALALSTLGKQVAKKDFDGNGTKDMFEMGMISYFKQTSRSSSGTDSAGNSVEF